MNGGERADSESSVVGSIRDACLRGGGKSPCNADQNPA